MMMKNLSNRFDRDAEALNAVPFRGFLIGCATIMLLCGCVLVTWSATLSRERNPLGILGVDPSEVARPILLLISIDGFRADYFGRFEHPALSWLAKRGVR